MQHANPLVADKSTMALMELAVAALLVAFVAVFIYGSRSNARIARLLSSTLQRHLRSQFAQIGTADGKTLIKDGHSFYWFYATGRRYTSGLTVAINLANRMDLFSYSSSVMNTPEKDRCIFILPLTSDCPIEPVSLFLVRKKELSRLRKLEDGSVNHVEALAGEVFAPTAIPSDIIAMSEHADIVSAYLPDSVRTIISDHPKHLMSLHVTTNGAKWDPQSKLSEKLIRLEFTLPNKEEEMKQMLCDMTDAAMLLLDQVATVKVSPEARKKALDLRKMVALKEDKRLQKERAEKAAKRKEEKKKEEEQAIGNMSRDKQRKYEEKKRKKELSARMRKASKK